MEMLLDYRDGEDYVLQICWIVFTALRLVSYPTDGRTDTRREHETNVWRSMNIAYQRRILLGLQRLVLYLPVTLYKQNKFKKPKFEKYRSVRVVLHFRCFRNIVEFLVG